MVSSCPSAQDQSGAILGVREEFYPWSHWYGLGWGVAFLCSPLPGISGVYINSLLEKRDVGCRGPPPLPVTGLGVMTCVGSGLTVVLLRCWVSLGGFARG